ncbi:hypothetical protein IE81DRAFT_357444 [Ceraceosorus guamensis]|uniref:Uncharacterized protein n=1 Tax=Ceraceosorus guamensis TaxID=1522189 RepID=A0A316VXL1_9BASI|nr:hypothetical protein IE81DRAFT_357444 [Ceraceosorus guamensis]PWN42192.1 hypothetical protein IE81DRAFT_357444 [Ceraceosorus guamensis]
MFYRVSLMSSIALMLLINIPYKAAGSRVQDFPIHSHDGRDLQRGSVDAIQRVREFHSRADGDRSSWRSNNAILCDKKVNDAMKTGNYAIHCQKKQGFEYRTLKTVMLESFLDTGDTRYKWPVGEKGTSRLNNNKAAPGLKSYITDAGRRATADTTTANMQTAVVDILHAAGWVPKTKYDEGKWKQLGNQMYDQMRDSIIDMEQEIAAAPLVHCGMNPNGYYDPPLKRKKGGPPPPPPVKVPTNDPITGCCKKEDYPDSNISERWRPSDTDFQSGNGSGSPNQCSRKSCDPKVQCCLKADGKTRKDASSRRPPGRREMLSGPILAGQMQYRANPNDCKKGDDEDRTTVNEAEAANAQPSDGGNPAKGGDPYAISQLRKALTAGSVPAAAALAAAAVAAPAAAAALSAAAAAAPAAATAVAAVVAAPEAAAAAAAIAALSTAASTSLPAYQALDNAAKTSKEAATAFSKLGSPPPQDSGPTGGDDGGAGAATSRTSSSVLPTSTTAPSDSLIPIADMTSSNTSPKPTATPTETGRDPTDTTTKPPGNAGIPNRRFVHP